MSLPNLIPLSNYNTSECVDIAYEIFKNEIANAQLFFLDLPIKFPWHPPFDNKHFCFWHCITKSTESKQEKDRIPSIERCERVHWLKYVLEHANNNELIWC